MIKDLVIEKPLIIQNHFDRVKSIDFKKLIFFLLLLSPQLAFASTGVMPSSSSRSLLKYCFCGGAASVFACNFVHPLEILKVRLQTNPSKEKYGVN